LTAASSKQAIEGLSQQELMPEVIVSDYHLADELGPDAVAAILRAQRLRFGVGPGIASILVTGDPELADAEGSALKRGLPLLVKPVSLEALNTALGQRLAELADGYLDD
jgi:CheY-like chemotaxis protein